MTPPSTTGAEAFREKGREWEAQKSEQARRRKAQKDAREARAYDDWAGDQESVREYHRQLKANCLARLGRAA